MNHTLFSFAKKLHLPNQADQSESVQTHQVSWLAKKRWRGGMGYSAKQDSLADRFLLVQQSLHMQ